MKGSKLNDRLDWRKASACGESACVEVAFTADVVMVRDGKGPAESPALRYTRPEWDAFIQGVKQGEFDA